jgi:flagellar basal-body rod protein FlgB
LKYRNPYQASLDGNTVEMPVEQAAFSENNVRYQASLNFINLTIAELTLAIAGSRQAKERTSCRCSMCSTSPEAV